MIAQVREYDFDDINRQITEIIEASYSFDAMKIVAGMKALVPEFKSLNSAFASLDRSGVGVR